jgi:hypothetical protein
VTGRDALLRAFDAGDALRPTFDTPQIASLARAIQHVTGGPLSAADPVAAELATHLRGPEHLVVFLADGCGLNFVRDLPQNGALRSHLHTEMQALFPTSTGPNLFAFSGATWPAEHGFLGWDVYLPSAGRVITPYLWRTADDSTDLNELGIEPADVFRARPFAAASTWDRLTLQPARYAATPATRSTVGDDLWRGIHTLDDGADAVIERVTHARAPTLTYLYWPEPDSSAHRLGTDHPATRAAVAHVAQTFDRLATVLSGRARLVFLADHGHLDAPPAGRRRIDPDEPLARCLAGPVAGESRIGMFRVLEGQHEGFEQAFAERLGDDFHLLTADDADELRLFGPDPLPSETRARLGDYLAVSRRDATFEICRAGEEGRLLLASTHGGLTPAETLVPLVIA